MTARLRRGIIVGMEGSLEGRLLVASPTLLDPNFFRAVVYVVDHDEEGALGVILNRPSPVELDEALAGWDGAASPPTRVFVGGPVQPEAAVCLARPRPGAGDIIGDAITLLPGGIASVDLDGDPALVASAIESLRVFSGYAGWAAGQLDAEVDSGDWFVVDALPGDVFDPDPDDLWRRVLGRQDGGLRLLAHFPALPVLN
ncbi:MAG TPA: YqgE/AlgH family protein [Acidimicrobiia bacterium]|nr:YqgE/AlgH family protein [Acidimicrobiia bacterium]